ncbi:MAG TPA: DUF389 domain-containing protein [Segeticoccus sp.]|uniref:DUF389 domain-containing protein n=1 Tax=Segeticoccus sp. TaxID=2706531 RepID=UPI002D811086|nr:DUF389 domain-containing protein [Segeticoccus sp.]HET8599487.1 DUF389 domain-containing protein [Segeticoccus sp.]
MLHLRLRVPGELVDRVVALFESERSAVNLLVLPQAYRDPVGTMVMADLPRESAEPVLSALHELGVSDRGSITIVDDQVVISKAAEEAEQAAPGDPEDVVIWDLIEDQAREDARFTFAFVAFLALATLIASIGRLQDQPILIIAAMIVGPEFGPMAAISLAFVRPKWELLPRAVGTLVGGYLLALAVSSAVWTVVYRLGGFTAAHLHHGPRTDFIVQPNVWSFVIAVLAGVAGILSLTTDKSSNLVGVFISVTTIPAVGTLSLAVATLDAHFAKESIYQLVINIAGIIGSGMVTLAVQRLVWWRRGAGPRRRLSRAASTGSGHSGGQPWQRHGLPR